MPLASLHCPPPLRRRLPLTPRDHARRDRALELFDAERYAEAVRETLRYLLADAAAADFAGDEFHFVQGSARVHLHLDGDGLRIAATLATFTPAAQATAALRYFLTRLSATGQLFQPRLRDGTVTLEFSDRLALLHPLKLIEVLNKLPMEADRNDAWLTAQFGVDTPDRETPAPLEQAEFVQAQALWNAHWAAVDDLLSHSRRRRSLRFLGALAALAANWPRYALPLTGAVRARLHEAAEDFTDGDADPNKRESTLAKCVRDMRAVTEAELRASLGHARYAMQPLHEGSASLLSSMLGGGERMQGLDELHAQGHALEAATELISLYVYLLAHYAWPAEVDTALRAGLELASDKPWREAFTLLSDHAHATARAYGSHGDHEDEGESEEAAA